MSITVLWRLMEDPTMLKWPNPRVIVAVEVEVDEEDVVALEEEAAAALEDVVAVEAEDVVDEEEEVALEAEEVVEAASAIEAVGEAEEEESILGAVAMSAQSARFTLGRADSFWLI